jgi:hypothetical protein
MKKPEIIIPTVLLFSFVTFGVYKTINTKAGRLPAQTLIDGAYLIQGESTSHGPYTGMAQVINGSVQRLVRFSNYKYQENEVEQIWSGKIQSENILFDVKLSHTLTAFNDYAPKDEAFNPIKIKIPKERFQSEIKMTLHDGEELREDWRPTGGPVGVPLWNDERKATEAVGEESTLVKFVKKISKLERAIKNYQEHPEIKKYENRPEFQAGVNYIIRDKTDFNFYRKNPRVLRVTNRSVNPLSLAEALLKRNAYGKTLSEKEQILRQDTIRYNFNKAGILENAYVDGSGNKTGRQTEYDTALWTSMFGWSELLRYETTKDASALANYKMVLDAVLTLIEITNDPKEFARGLAISPADEVIGDGWVQGEGKYAHLKWRKGGNNDMIKGVFITLALAHKVVRPEETALIERIKKNAKALASLNPVEDRDFNLALAHGIDALWNRNEDLVDEFYSKIINYKNKLLEMDDLSSGYYFGAIADWSGINLTMTSNLSQLLVARELQSVFTEKKIQAKARKLELNAEEKLSDMYRIYKNTNRDFLVIMTYAHNEKFRNDPENRTAIQEALWGLRELPAPRNIGSAHVDLKKHPEWSVSSWPRQPWKALTGFRKLIDGYDYSKLRQGVYAYPLFEGSAWDSTYVWKDRIYDPEHHWNGNMRTFSSDYLLVYWAARSSNLINEKD